MHFEFVVCALRFYHFVRELFRVRQGSRLVLIFNIAGRAHSHDLLENRLVFLEHHLGSFVHLVVLVEIAGEELVLSRRLLVR